MVPPADSFRTVMVSAMYRLPAASTAKPRGFVICAAAGGSAIARIAARPVACHRRDDPVRGDLADTRISAVRDVEIALRIQGKPAGKSERRAFVDEIIRE